VTQDPLKFTDNRVFVGTMDREDKALVSFQERAAAGIAKPFAYLKVQVVHAALNCAVGYIAMHGIHCSHRLGK
jgi:hypothetical protein